MSKWKNIPLVRLYEHIQDIFIKINPILAVIYRPAFHRKFAYRMLMIHFLIIPTIGFWRFRMVKNKFKKHLEIDKEIKEEAITEKMKLLDIKLSQFEQDYFVVIEANTKGEKGDKQIENNQRILFQLNQQINQKLQISPEYFNNVKFLFIGSQVIYQLLQEQQNTNIQFYQAKIQQNSPMLLQKESNYIHVIARETNGNEVFLSTLKFRADLNSILKFISKHKSKKFVRSMNFG